MKFQHFKNDCRSTKGLWIPGLYSDMTPELAERYGHICSTMLFISEKYYDLYFEEKHMKYFISMGHISVWGREELVIWVQISIFFMVKSILRLERCMSHFWQCRWFSAQSFDQRQQQAPQNIVRKTADTMAEKANAMISIRQIYSPGKQRELGDYRGTYGPESLVKVNYWKTLRRDFVFKWRYFHIKDSEEILRSFGKVRSWD